MKKVSPNINKKCVTEHKKSVLLNTELDIKNEQSEGELLLYRLLL